MFKDLRVYFQKLVKPATIPQRANDTDAGADLFSIEKTVIKAGKDAVVRTGLRTRFNDGFVMLFKDKSGRSVNDKLTVGAGVIDSEYRGELLVHMYNNGDKDVEIKKQEKIAQFLIIPCWTGQPREVDSISTDTDRGTGGIGSTGLKK